MPIVKTVIDRFSLQKPAAKTSLVVILILAQCCVCFLPMTFLGRAADGAAARSNPAVVQLHAARAAGLTALGLPEPSGFNRQVAWQIEPASLAR